MKKLILTAYLGIRGICLAPFLLFRKTFSPRDEEIRSILFLRYDRIGDMVAATPVFRAFKERFPSSRITVLASEKNAPVIAHNPCVDEALIFRGASDLDGLRKRSFDLVVDLFYTYELRPAWVSWLIRSRYRLGFEIAGRQVFFNVKGPATASGAMPERLLSLGRPLGVIARDPKPEMFLIPAETSWAREYLSAKKVDLGHLKVALHPGAFFQSQRWPLENYVALARVLRERFLAQVLIFCGQEEEIIRSAFTTGPSGGFWVFSRLALREMAALLRECRLLVCNNSGPLHVAAALGVPTVSMLGPTDAALWSPLGLEHIVLKKDLPCLGCGRPECEDQRCLKSITVDEVAAAVEQQLKRKGHAAS